MNYSLDKAREFGWASIGTDLPAERVSLLQTFLVNKRVLDAGCGGGAYVDYLSRGGLDVTGVDRYQPFLQLARKNGRGGNFVQGDITNLPFQDKTFDCTYCFDVLEHVDDYSVIKELARVTAKRLILTVPAKDETLGKWGLTFYHYQDQTHLRYYTETDLRELVSAINCSNSTIFPEAAVHMHLFIREMIEFDKVNAVIPFLEPFYKLKVGIPLLNKIFMRGSAFILKRLIDTTNFEKLTGRFLKDSITYKQLNTSLMAVIDL